VTWFKRMEAPKVKGEGRKASVPSGLWKKCESCGQAHLAEEVMQALETCPSCGFHFRMGARDRLESFLDQGSITELAADLAAFDVLGFKDSKKYSDRIKSTLKTAGEQEAFILS